MNLSDSIIAEIKKVLPREIKIKTEEAVSKEAPVMNQKTEPILPPIGPSNNLSDKQNQKLELVLEIKEKHNHGLSFRQLAKDYQLSRSTVSKYVNMLHPREDVKYDNSNPRYSHFDQYKEEIADLCHQHKTVTEVKEKLEKLHNEKISYSSLNSYIRKHQLKPKKSKQLAIQSIAKDKAPNHIKILRGKIIKYIFGWNQKNNDVKVIETNSNNLESQFSIIKLFKQFYTSFKSTLLNQDWVGICNIINTVYDNKVISKFVKGLANDYEAVINSAKYSYSNGCVEGNVNKLKKIKRDMYGRAHIDLLRNKVIYQSLYF